MARKMKNQNQHRFPAEAVSASIDQWQDDAPVPGPWIDNPVWGTLAMVCATIGLFTWSALTSTGRSSGESQFADDPMLLEEIRELNGQPTPMAPTPMDPAPMGMTPSREIASPSPSPTADVSELLSELVNADETGRNTYELKMELAKNGCDDSEIVRRLSRQLRETVDVKMFGKILNAIEGVSYIISDKPDIKQQFVNALAIAGRHVKTSDLKAMDRDVPNLILNAAKLPETSNLLGEIAAIDDQWGHRVLDKLSRTESNLAAETSVKIVRDKNINPSYLRNRDSLVVCQFLWEGKLEEKENFSQLSVGDDKTSVKAFANAAAAKLNSDPRGAVEALMSLTLHRYARINRKTLPSELVRKIDDVLSANVERHFVDTGESIYDAKKRAKKGKGPFAFLDLAEHLGGTKTIVGIGKMGKRNPAAIQKFHPIRDLLLTVNEPETYDAIATATAFHGKTRTNAIEKKIGQAIEPAFLRRIQFELNSQPSKKEINEWGKRIGNLLDVIDQIGTRESIPTLQQITKTKSRYLKGRAEKTLKRIRGDASLTAKPSEPRKPTAATPSESASPKTGKIKVSTDSGQAFRSSIDNIVQGRILPSDIQDKLAFDSETMWHSNLLESGWATVELEFPEQITLNKIQIYSQHTGKNHLVIAAKVYAVNGNQSKLLCNADGLKQFDSLAFTSTSSKKWKLELQAGKSKKVVLRGLRFFNGKQELYPPKELPPGEK